MSEPREIKGVLPVFPTPFNDDESVDEAALSRVIDFSYDCGVHGVVMAMVSETLRMTTEERRKIAELAVKHGRDRGVVILSAGAECTYNAVEYAKHAEAIGADGVMAIPPVSNAVGEAELGKYYRAIINAIKIPVIVQDASGYVGKPISIGLQSELLHEFGPARVQYKPEANPIGPKLSELRDATDGQARVFEGTGGIMLVDSHRRGIVGTMPAVELADVLVALWNKLEQGAPDAEIYAIAEPLTSIVSLMTNLDAFLLLGKYLMRKRGVLKNMVVRGPLGYHLDEETRVEVDRRFERAMASIGK
jgi:4-hydroxy-tetrahydrodipicolinate synthase